MDKKNIKVSSMNMVSYFSLCVHYQYCNRKFTNGYFFDSPITAHTCYFHYSYSVDDPFDLLSVSNQDENSKRIIP